VYCAAYCRQLTGTEPFHASNAGIQQGIETSAALHAAVLDCAAHGDKDTVVRAALHACVTYLWLVHGADYFQGDLYVKQHQCYACHTD
jgi:hypothetical protein